MAEIRARGRLLWRIGEVVETRDSPHQEPFPGGARLVETVAMVLVELGRNPARVKTERFGPTGG